MNFLAKVYVILKPSVNDPQGLAVLGALKTLGYQEVSAVRVGKYLEVRLEAPDSGAAEQRVEAMCRQLLANPVIELYRFEVQALAEAGRA
ncbi:MAG: phosphoribosylformylglycinamidine synthase subunit PurS [Chloroflexi bacterium]|nr:phosphoribosylformylglycinamidine synthase subunit PurS [Chloroflexota bacterium]